ncbi:MAG TPA: ferrochelatase [Polyangiaceae bacterium]|jgi:ferrochelatase|nr:ferrochelatase [Polyangiaceae bacterium]
MTAAVLLVSHGTVDDLEDLAAFVTQVRRGRPPGADLVAELRRRYEAIGGRSPLNAVNARLAAKLGAHLGTRTAWANRLWRPSVRDVLAQLAADGVGRVAVVPLAQHSAHVYADDARAAAEGTGLALACAPGWGERAELHAAFVERIERVLGDPVRTTVLFTAHSLPRAVVEHGDPYEREVRAAAAAIAERLGPGVRTAVAFQSQGFGAPGEWLGPDLAAALDEAAAGGDARVVVAPVGFLADHVEILYDLDIEAAAMARERGLAFVRAPSLNDDDDLVAILADVARPLLAELGQG